MIAPGPICTIAWKEGTQTEITETTVPGVSLTISFQQKNREKPWRRSCGSSSASQRAFLQIFITEGGVFLCGLWVLFSNPLGPRFPSLPVSSRGCVAEGDFPPETENLDPEDWSRKDFVPEMLLVPLALCSVCLHVVSSVPRAACESHIWALRTELICAFLPNNRKLADAALGPGVGVGGGKCFNVPWSVVPCPRAVGTWAFAPEGEDAGKGRNGEPKFGFSGCSMGLRHGSSPCPP